MYTLAIQRTVPLEERSTMSDLKIRKKIRNTRLFSDSQKIDLLVNLEEASLEDKKKLESGIDMFDREYKISME